MVRKQKKIYLGVILCLQLLFICCLSESTPLDVMPMSDPNSENLQSFNVLNLIDASTQPVFNIEGQMIQKDLEPIVQVQVEEESLFSYKSIDDNSNLIVPMAEVLSFDSSIEALSREKIFYHSLYPANWFLGVKKQVEFINTNKTDSITQNTPNAPSKTIVSLPMAENGDFYNQDNDGDGRVESVFVKGYYRKNGTYVRSHYRAAPRR